MNDRYWRILPIEPRPLRGGNPSEVITICGASAGRRGRSTNAQRSVSDRSLRQGKQGDTVEAIAPDAATLRSRHVARRMGSTIIPYCGSSWTVLWVAFQRGKAGRAVSPAKLSWRADKQSSRMYFHFTCAMLRRNAAFKFVSCAR